MKTFIVKLKSELNKNKLRVIITRFLRITPFKTRYVNVQLKLYTLNNTIINVGENFILDVKKEDEIKNFKLYIEHNYLSFSLKNKDWINFGLFDQGIKIKEAKI